MLKGLGERGEFGFVNFGLRLIFRKLMPELKVGVPSPITFLPQFYKLFLGAPFAETFHGHSEAIQGSLTASVVRLRAPVFFSEGWINLGWTVAAAKNSPFKFIPATKIN